MADHSSVLPHAFGILVNLKKSIKSSPYLFSHDQIRGVSLGALIND